MSANFRSRLSPMMPRRKVHQAYLGRPSEVVQESMRHIHTLLQEIGVETLVFASNVGGPRNIRQLGDLPRHEDYALVLHHQNAGSSEEFTAIAAISAPVVLLHYSTSNQASLPRWKPFAMATLGRDPLATLALRGAGYSDAATLYFPPVQRTAVPSDEEGARPFTIIVPGDITGDSLTITVVDAFVRFRHLWAMPARLVLLGRTLDAPVARDVQDRISAHNLADIVLITGTTDAASRSRWIATADICLCLGELPVTSPIVFDAIEAGLPVLARPVPAVAYALSPSGLPDTMAVSPPQPDDVAHAILDVAKNPARAQALAADRKRHAEASEAKSAEAVFWNALGRCGVARPFVAANQATVLAQTGFILAGPFAGAGSIASTNRMLAAALERRRPGRVSALPASAQPFGSIKEAPSSEVLLMNTLFQRSRPFGAPTVLISYYVPPHIPAVPNDLPLAFFAWEGNLIPVEMIGTLNAGFVGVLAASRIVAKALIDSGLRIPVRVISQAVDIALFGKLEEQRAARQALKGTVDRAMSEPFVFLRVSSRISCRSIDVLLTAWVSAFTRADPVRLVIASFINPQSCVSEHLRRFQAESPNMAPVELVQAGMTQEKRLDEYHQANAIILQTYDEDSDKVAAEAMVAGIPLIVIGYGGHMDFLDGSRTRLLDFRFAQYDGQVGGSVSLRAEPDVNDLASAFREAVEDDRTGGIQAQTRATVSREDAVVRFDTTAWADRVADAAHAIFIDSLRPLSRLVWVSSWGVRCGIAEYSKALIESRPIEAASDVKLQILVLCDMRTSAVPSIPEFDGVRISPAWHAGSASIAAEISRKLAQFDPEILIIQHQAGLISWDSLIGLVEMGRVLCVPTLVTLHSTMTISMLDHQTSACVLVSLATVDRVIVHTLRDVEYLRDYGIVDNVMLLPHGALPLADRPTSSKVSRKERHGPLIGCYGFFLPPKGISVLIESFAELRKRWPKAQLRLVNAQFPSPISEQEIEHCRVLARQLMIDEATDWHTGYLDDDVATTLLAECDLIVMPYADTYESASGAVRHALHSGVPVAVSKIAIFDELGEAVHRLDASSAVTLTQGLTRLIEDKTLCLSTVSHAAKWLRGHDWNTMSARLFGMADGLLRQGQAHSGHRSTVFAGNSKLLFCHPGTSNIRGTARVFSGEGSGFGVFGPYIRLPPGRYRVRYQFDRSSSLIGCAHFDVISDIGVKVLAQVDAAFFPEGYQDHVIELFFTAAEPLLDVEIRIFCHLGFQATLLTVSVQEDSQLVPL